eukprot:5142860-Pyramimonas_sp.AAC.1
MSEAQKKRSAAGQRLRRKCAEDREKAALRRNCAAENRKRRAGGSGAADVLRALLRGVFLGGRPFV